MIARRRGDLVAFDQERDRRRDAQAQQPLQRRRAVEVEQALQIGIGGGSSPRAAPEKIGKNATIAASAMIARSGWSTPAQIPHQRRDCDQRG